jgi:hypothetical protein
MYNIYQYVISCCVRKLRREVSDKFQDVTVPKRKATHATANKLRQIMDKKG